MSKAEGLSAAQLDACAIVLTEILRGTAPADSILSRWFHAHRAGSHDRAFIAETVYAVLRRRRWLERQLDPAATPRQLMLAALIKLQGISLRRLLGALRGPEQAWVEALKALPAIDPGQLTLAEQADFPDWLTERLRADRSDDALLQLARAMNQVAPLDLRVNTLKSNRADALAALTQSGLHVDMTPYSPWGLRIAGRPPLSQMPLFIQGAIEVQDEGAQLAGLLLMPRRGELVVDFCAGAGGKSLLLGMLMRSTGRLYAFDTSARRLAQLKPRLARSGLSNIHPVLIESENDQPVKRLFGKCDRVLVDAPCSGLGTLRRNPDMKWRQTPQTVSELAAKQGRILAAAVRLLKPGGTLVYATCSILHEENAAIVDALLAVTPQLRRLDAVAVLARQGIQLPHMSAPDLVLSPQHHGTDGFYAALLERWA